MDVAEIRALLPYLTPEERAELDALLVADIQAVPWRPLPGPQLLAYESRADITGYGGAAGGGKTDLAAGLTLTAHDRTLFVRREKAQTEGFVQRVTEILGSADGYSSQKGAWRLSGGRLCELAGLDNPGDERRWQGRPHDLKVFDEVTEMREQQVRFVMGWMRTGKSGQRSRVLMTFNPPTTIEGRWVIGFFGPWLDRGNPLYPTPPGEIRYAAMLPDGKGGARDVWLDSDGQALTGAPFVLVEGRVTYDFDPKAYRSEDIVTPKSRTFIPARTTDNPFLMDTGYLSTLQSLPEPLRSQMLYGDFSAGIEDDPWQVIPTAWVEAAQARWRRPDRFAPMDSLGVDVARGGRDSTILARRHGMWFDAPLTYPGKDTPDGPTVAGLVVAALRNRAVIHLDVIGVGASPYDFLVQAGQQIVGVNVAEAARGADRSGRLRFLNLRSELWWRMREALDPINNTGIALPPEPRLLADLTVPTWSMSGATLKVAGREEIVQRIGRSPDFGSAYVLALMDTPKRAAVEALGQARSRLDYDPYARL